MVPPSHCRLPAALVDASRRIPVLHDVCRVSSQASTLLVVIKCRIAIGFKPNSMLVYAATNGHLIWLLDVTQQLLLL